MADVEEVWIGGGEGLPAGPGDLGGDTVGEAHLAPAPVVMPGPKSPGRRADRRINGHAIDEAQLGKVERRILLVRSGEANEVVEHLRYAEGGQRRIG